MRNWRASNYDWPRFKSGFETDRGGGTSAHDLAVRILRLEENRVSAIAPTLLESIAESSPASETRRICRWVGHEQCQS